MQCGAGNLVENGTKNNPDYTSNMKTFYHTIQSRDCIRLNHHLPKHSGASGSDISEQIKAKNEEKNMSKEIRYKHSFKDHDKLLGDLQ